VCEIASWLFTFFMTFANCSWYKIYLLVHYGEAAITFAVHREHKSFKWK